MLSYEIGERPVAIHIVESRVRSFTSFKTFLLILLLISWTLSYGQWLNHRQSPRAQNKVYEDEDKPRPRAPEPRFRPSEQMPYTPNASQARGYDSSQEYTEQAQPPPSNYDPHHYHQQRYGRPAHGPYSNNGPCFCASCTSEPNYVYAVPPRNTRTRRSTSRSDAPANANVRYESRERGGGGSRRVGVQESDDGNRRYSYVKKRW